MSRENGDYTTICIKFIFYGVHAGRTSAGLASTKSSPDVTTPEIRAVAFVEPDPERYYTVTAHTRGWIDSIIVMENRHVKKGQILATLHTPDCLASIEDQNDVQHSREKLRAARDIYRHQQKLVKDKLSSSADLAAAKIRWKNAQIELKHGLCTAGSFETKDGP